MKKIKLTVAMMAMAAIATAANIKTYNVKDYGLRPNSGRNASPVLKKITDRIKKDCQEGDSVVIRFEKGKYFFLEKGAAVREYYISNHDQDNPKKVGIALENCSHCSIDGNGAELIFDGRMLPLAIINSKNNTIENLSIDFRTPHITQVKIVENSEENGITFEPAPWVNYRINDKGYFEAYGTGWSLQPFTGIAFEEKNKHIVYNTSDLGFSTKGAKEVGKRKINAPEWKDGRLVPGTVVAMRSWQRPAPGIFLSENVNTILKNVKVHYAEGMGLLAQLCENISMDRFSVCLKGDSDPRFFTTQADATHFSGCKGHISSVGGLYEGMMDDAINVHGTYLKVVRRISDCKFVGRYMHPQTYGFKWGECGDSLQFVRSKTMELEGTKNCIKEIVPFDRSEVKGAKEFLITTSLPVPDADLEEGMGVENLTWTPSVYFAENTIRNNRARGTLFSTPQPVVVENNFFDHTSGSAVLLCGDCNGWYETGACRNVIIRKNHFKNALTNLFQFTNAVISIYPEIPDLKSQHQYFHGGKAKSIVIEDNLFETFDAPVVYAKSVDGLLIRNNRIIRNSDYRPFHWNQSRYLLEHTGRVEISE